MNSVKRRIGIMFVGLLVAVVLTGCPNLLPDEDVTPKDEEQTSDDDGTTEDEEQTSDDDGTTEDEEQTPTSPEEAEQLADEGTTALNDQDWEAAHDKFAQAVQADPENGLAALGYVMTEMATIATDPGMVTLAQDRLGLADYPSSMDTLFSEEWLEEVQGDTDSEDNPIWLLPEIKNEDATDEQGNLKYDFDGSEAIDRYDEKAYAFGAYFVQQNPNGFNEVVDDLTTVLEDRLGAALDAVDAIPEDAQIRFTYKMFFDSEADALDAGWPVSDPESSDPQPLELVIGKEEVQFIGSYMRMVRHQVYIGQVFNYSLPLKEYWNAAWTLDSGGTLDSYPTTPFAAGFLQEAEEASTALSNAKADLQAALSDVKTASEGIRSRGSSSPYAVSEDSDFLSYFAGTEDDLWADLSTTLEFEERTVQEVQDSLSNNDFAYFPIDDGEASSDIEYFNDALNNWPTADGGHSPKTSFNFGKFYAAPQITVSNFLDLYKEDDAGAKGDPVYYTWNESASSFDEVTEEPSVDDQLYIRVPDISLGGAINDSDLDKLTVDDPETIEIEVDKSSWDIYVLIDPSGSEGFNQLAAHSFVAEGRQTGFGDTSTGSFWWALVEMEQPESEPSESES